MRPKESIVLLISPSPNQKKFMFKTPANKELHSGSLKKLLGCW